MFVLIFVLMVDPVSSENHHHKHTRVSRFTRADALLVKDLVQVTDVVGIETPAVECLASATT